MEEEGQEDHTEKDPEKLFLSEEGEREDDGYENLQGREEVDHNGRRTARRTPSAHALPSGQATDAKAD